MHSNTITIPPRPITAADVPTWTIDAHKELQSWLPNLDIKLPILSPGIYNFAYIVLFGAEEIARIRGHRVTVTLVETDETFQPYYSSESTAVLEELQQQWTDLASSPETVGRDVREGMHHPIPGTPVPNHSQRREQLDRIVFGNHRPLPGNPGSMAWLTNHLREAQEGTASEGDVAFFDRYYGETRAAQDRPEPFRPSREPLNGDEDLELEDIMDDDDDEFEDDDMPDPSAARAAMDAMRSMLTRRRGLI